jgi:hypothetical protein
MGSAIAETMGTLKALYGKAFSSSALQLHHSYHPVHNKSISLPSKSLKIAVQKHQTISYSYPEFHLVSLLYLL